MKTKTFKYVKMVKKILANLTKTARKLKKRVDVKISSDAKTITYYIVK
jgi:hypothetical protein